MDLYYPINVSSSIEAEDSIKFLSLLSRETIRLQKPYANYVKDFLSFCDGRTSIEKIAGKLHCLNSQIEIFDEFSKEMNLIVPSESLSSEFISVGNNPQIYPSAPGYSKPSPLIQYSACNYETEEAALPSIYRHSTRLYDDRNMQLCTLEKVLSFAYSISDTKHSVASGGALFPIDIYVLALRVQGLKQGIYLWDPIKRCLKGNVGGVLPPIAYAFDNQYAENPACWYILAKSSRSQDIKYGNRGIRYSFLEAGQIAARLEIECEHNNLGFLWYEGFSDNGIKESIINAPHRISEQDLETPIPLLCCATGYEQKKISYNHTIRRIPLIDSLRIFANEHGWIGYQQPTNARIYENYYLYHQSFMFHTADGTEKWSYGTDETIEQTTIKALAEAIERYTCTKSIPDERLEKTNFADKRVLSIRKIYPFSEGQISDLGLRAETADSTVECVKAERYSCKSEVYVPVDLITYWNHQREPYCRANSNGVAAYSTYSGARERALCELIERHSFLSHWYAGIACPQITAEGDIKKRFDILKKDRKDPFLLDLSVRGLPISACLIFQDKPPYVVFGLGSGKTLYDACKKASFEAIDATIGWTQSWKELNKEIVNRLGSDPAYPQWGKDHMWWYARNKEQSIRTKFLIGNSFSNPNVIFDWNQLIQDFDPIFFEYNMVINDLHVVRAISEHCIPLMFGVRDECNMFTTSLNQTSNMPHPIS